MVVWLRYGFVVRHQILMTQQCLSCPHHWGLRMICEYSRIGWVGILVEGYLLWMVVGGGGGDCDG